MLLRGPTGPRASRFSRLTCLVNRLRRGPYGLVHLKAPSCSGLIRIRVSRNQTVLGALTKYLLTIFRDLA